MTEDSSVRNSEIDHLIARFYACFDNRDGRAIDMISLRAVFLPDARITRIASSQIDSWSVDEFIAPRAAMLTDGSLVDFYEWEVEGDTTILGNIAQHRSQYRKSGRLRGGAPYIGEGRKFILLCQSTGRWRIVSVLWEDV